MKLKSKTRTRSIHIRCEPKQLTRWERAAAKAKRTLSDWARLVLDAKAK